MMLNDRTPRRARAVSVGRSGIGILGVLAAVGLAVPAPAVAQTLTPERALLHRQRVLAVAGTAAASPPLTTPSIATRLITGERALLGRVVSVEPPKVGPVRPTISPRPAPRLTGEEALLGRSGERRFSKW